MTEAAAKPETVAAEKEKLALSAKAWIDNFQITTDQDYALADKASGRMHQIKKTIKAEEDEICVPLFQGYKAAKAFFRKPMDVVDVALGATKKKMDTYRAEKRRKAEAEAAEAQRKLDEERREAQRKVDEANRKLREAQDAEDAKKAAAEAEAAKVAAEEMPTQVAVVEPELADENTTTRKVWKFEITDEAEVPHGEFRICKPDEVAIRAFMTKETKAGRLPALPGVKFWEDEDTRMKRGAGR